ncbi:MAG TPA: Grx4 family monothiol glutaredoxin [Polyangiaceae bacterium]|nr:Grx4 family monothiol glutaredoxin [Polyangiaceae bacterium]
MALSEALRQKFSDLVSNHRVVLFMKGTRRAPQCGFSAQVVQILDELAPDYRDVDVLESPEVRDGIKLFTNWPTIPQVFIDGKFVGGCDIVREMYQSNELQRLLGVDVAPVLAPSVTLSAGALSALSAALEGSEGDVLHLEVSPRFDYDLFVAARRDSDLEAKTEGPSVFFDSASARRVSSVSIDFIAGPEGGFKITSPEEPPKVREVDVNELKARLDRGEIELFDVRPSHERALASIAQARPLDAEGQEFLRNLDRETPIAFHCHHGFRSQAAAQQMLAEGFRNVYNVTGGIEAWSQRIDPSVPRY